MTPAGTRCGMKLRELVEVAGVNHYGSVATALRNLERRQRRDRELARRILQAERQLMNTQM